MEKSSGSVDSSSSNPDHLNSLTKLSPKVWLRPATSPPDGKPAHFVVLCGWLHASLRHVSKYAHGYAEIYPHSTILIVQCQIADALVPWNSDWHRKRLKPVLDMIKKSAALSSPSSSSSPSQSPSEEKVSLTVQAFSNAGLGTAWLLLRYLSELSLLQSLLTGVVLDSCPGSGGYRTTVNAFRVAAHADRKSLLSPVRISVEVGAHIGVFVVHSLIPMLASGRQNVIKLSGQGLNDPNLVGLEVPKLYIYSKADAVIPDKEIVRHVEEARKKGYAGVHEEVYVDTAHCGHLVSDPERYWAAVLEATGPAAPAENEKLEA